MNSKKDWRIVGEDRGTIRSEIETKEQALEFASDFASQHDAIVKVYEAIAVVKPERAPVSVTTL